MANNKKASDDPGKRKQDGRTREGQAARDRERAGKDREESSREVRAKSDDDKWETITNVGSPVSDIEIQIRED